MNTGITVNKIKGGYEVLENGKYIAAFPKKFDAYQYAIAIRNQIRGKVNEQRIV